LLTGVRLRNFNCYRDTGDIRLRPLTLLIGPNNVGKSALLEGLLLLKQTFEDRDPEKALVTSGTLVDLGSFHDILRGGRNGKNRNFAVEMALAEQEADRYAVDSKRFGPLSSSNVLAVTFGFRSKANAATVSSIELRRGKRRTFRASGAGRSWEARGLPESARRYAGVELLHFFPRVLLRSPPPSSRAVEQVTEFALATQAQLHLWAHGFDDLHHIGGIRAPIPRFNVLGEMPSSEVGAGGENLLSALRSAVEIGREADLLSQVNMWISQRFSILRQLRFKNLDPEGTVRALLGDERGGFRGINVASMGQGVSQLLPVIAGAVATRSGETVFVEQPEIHLHPAAQADLGDLFVDTVRERRGSQFIVETHSEHLLLRIRARIAEGDLNPENFLLLLVERKARETTVRELEADSRGHFQGWPHGFFEEGYQEALRLAEAGAPEPP
jgi:predicted ATPase